MFLYYVEQKIFDNVTILIDDNKIDILENIPQKIIDLRCDSGKTFLHYAANKGKLR